MNWIALIISTFLLFSSESHARGSTPVPKSLFGVELGQVFTATRENPTGSLSIKQWTGSKRFLGAGLHYYFEPLKKYKAFEYLEKNEGDSEYYETSFALYNFQIIPENIKDLSELESLETSDFLVSKIYWQVPFDDDSTGYYWALDLCQVFASDLRVEPKILNMSSIKDYQCIFSEEDRELTVWSFGLVSLKYVKEKFDRLNDKFQSQIDKLRANEIKPY